MIREDRVTMRGKELRRVPVIRHVLDWKLTQVEAATGLGLSPRQVRRVGASRAWLALEPANPRGAQDEDPPAR